jgi:hypothetical protein
MSEFNPDKAALYAASQGSPLRFAELVKDARRLLDAEGLTDDERRKEWLRRHVKQPLVSARHIVNLQGKDFVTFPGLLEMAHKNGLNSIDSVIVSIDHAEQTAVFQATASGSRGRFTGTGDASPSNVGKNIQPSYIRMGETRAIARALRLYLGIGMCSSDELPS